jgi:hypothetical protein
VIALDLLARYFQLPDAFDHAQAHVDRATALPALGCVADAITAYEAAITRESVFPNLLTQAYLDLPYAVITRGMREQYPCALELLHLHESRLIFPVDRFRWHVAGALIAADVHQTKAARSHAQQALDAAFEHSGCRYHPSVVLVTDQYDGLITKLVAILAA